jgi:glycosyltransferase involved in cell wall biosynthesis
MVSASKPDKKANKILCLTLEPISARMAGPAIRCLELGRQLAREFTVTVASPCPVEKGMELSTQQGFAVVAGATRNEIENLAVEADVIFLQANVLKPFPKLANLGKFIVVDLYDPYLFSLLAQYPDNPATASSSYRLMHQVLEHHMKVADFTVCASERQRDYWLGRFCSLGRLDPRMCRFDPTLRKLIDVAPFGLADGKPIHRKAAIKGVIDGIGIEDKVLLWTGGIWDWFDPLTVIKAVARCHEDLPQLRLFFMGMKSPNPQVPLMPMAIEAQKLAKDLGLLNKAVFFNDTWINYDERANYLLEADAAVSAHFDTIETRFSFRTRILDNLWANLPVLTTGGDQLAELISNHRAGIAIDYNDVDGWTDAIKKVVTDRAFNESCRAESQKLAQKFTWEKSAEPLLAYCRQPYHLPAYQKVTMPSLFERAHAVYSRGGKELVIKRSRELINDLKNPN